MARDHRSWWYLPQKFWNPVADVKYLFDVNIYFAELLCITDAWHIGANLTLWVSAAAQLHSIECSSMATTHATHCTELRAQLRHGQRYCESIQLAWQAASACPHNMCSKGLVKYTSDTGVDSVKQVFKFCCTLTLSSCRAFCILGPALWHLKKWNNSRGKLNQGHEGAEGTQNQQQLALSHQELSQCTFQIWMKPSHLFVVDCRQMYLLLECYVMENAIWLRKLNWGLIEEAGLRSNWGNWSFQTAGKPWH